VKDEFVIDGHETDLDYYVSMYDSEFPSFDDETQKLFDGEFKRTGVYPVSFFPPSNRGVLFREASKHICVDFTNTVWYG
jgi:hypothetical protein